MSPTLLTLTILGALIALTWLIRTSLQTDLRNALHDLTTDTHTLTDPRAPLTTRDQAAKTAPQHARTVYHLTHGPLDAALYLNTPQQVTAADELRRAAQRALANHQRHADQAH